MKKFIVANWKKNPATEKEAQDLFDAVKNSLGNSSANVVICPPNMYLPVISEKKGLTVGAQDFQPELKNLNIKYVIVGHSDRRKLGETNDVINKKIKSVLADTLTPIFCVGEKEGENKEEVLEKQISEGLKDIQDISNVIVAYEPVWAIGTGNNCSIEETKKSVEFIKKVIGKEIRVLYGGSVNSQNSASYLKDGGVDGLLVGGASLNAEEFSNIVKSA